MYIERITTSTDKLIMIYKKSIPTVQMKLYRVVQAIPG